MNISFLNNWTIRPHMYSKEKYDSVILCFSSVWSFTTVLLSMTAFDYWAVPRRLWMLSCRPGCIVTCLFLPKSEKAQQAGSFQGPAPYNHIFWARKEKFTVCVKGILFLFHWKLLCIFCMKVLSQTLEVSGKLFFKLYEIG